MTPAGPIKVELRKSPPLFLGPLDLGRESVIVAPDFRSSIQGMGEDAYGIVGMSALKDKIFTLDFDRGELRFLKDATGIQGQAVPLKWRLGAVFAVAEIAGVGKEEFRIDTSESDYHSGSIRKALFEEMLANRRMRLTSAGPQTSIFTGEVVSRRLGRCDGFVFAGFKHNGLVMNDTKSTANSLGRAYLSRYIVTFDMPRSTMFLLPGKNFNRVDRYDLSGLGIICLDGEMVVYNVTPNSSGDRAGIQLFDEIISVDGNISRNLTVFELCRMFAEPGRRRVVYERAGIRQETVVVLQEGG